VRELWVACHGYGQLAEPFAGALAPLDDGRRVVVVPEALSRFYLDDPAKRHGPDSPVGASWMTRADREREIADYVEYLDVVTETVGAELEAEEVSIVALGFSQGVATVCRWAALGRSTVHRLILWGGTVPQDLPTDRGTGLFRGAALVLVAGRKDGIVPFTTLRGERDALAARGLRADLVEHDGGHSLNSDALTRLASAGVSSDA
jgi:predicted esterase